MNKIIGFSFLALFSLLSFSSFAQSAELGLASYYGDKYHGSKTAYGDTYDRNKFTCAHKRHKYGTKLRVTRIDNKKSVIVKVTDKGPFIKGRVIDLSYVAAEKIGLVQDGVTEVKVEVVGKEKKEDTPTKTSSASNKTKDKTPEIVTQTVRPSEYDKIPERRDEISGDPISKPTASVKTTKTDKAIAATPKNELAKAGVFKIGTPDTEQRYAVQVASLNSYDNAARQVAILQGKWFKNVLLMAEPKEEGVSYKVLMGPFDSGKAAQHYQESLTKKHKIKGFVVSLPVESQTTAKGGEPTEDTERGVLLNAPERGDYGVQVASLDSFDAALRQADIMKAKWFKNILVKIEDDSFKVILGPQADETAAKNYKNSLVKNHKIKGFVVRLEE